jgi:hypothetical protein
MNPDGQVYLDLAAAGAPASEEDKARFRAADLITTGERLLSEPDTEQLRAEREERLRELQEQLERLDTDNG